MSKSAFIMSVYHKQHFSLQFAKKYFTPVQVGIINSKTNLNIQADNIGDNISNKNGNYCELTALYWAWKNIDCDYYGLMHYRRMFSEKYITTKYLTELIKFYLKKIFKLNSIYFGYRHFNGDYDLLFKRSKSLILKNLNKNTIIVPEKIKLTSGLTVKEQFCQSHPSWYWVLLKTTTLKLFPEIKNEFENLEASNWLYGFNMFIMPKSFYFDYMEWLYTILNKVEIEAKSNDKYSENSRIFGFIAERLLTLYIRLLAKKNIYILENPVVFLNA